MIKMRLVNVLIERLDLNLKDLTETHDKKLKRTSTIDTTETDDINDETREDEDCDHPIPKKMKLDYFPITMNVSVLVHNIYACTIRERVSSIHFRKIRQFRRLEVEISIIYFPAAHAVQPVYLHKALPLELMVRMMENRNIQRL